MPGMLEETEAILRFVAEELGSGTYVNVMPQYRPEGLVRRGDYPEIARRPGRDELLRAVGLALDLGLRVDARSAAEVAVLRP